MIDYAALESRLIAECDAAIAEGWKLVPGRFFTGQRGCCVFGAVVRDRRDVEDAADLSRRRLSIDDAVAVDVASGFDARDPDLSGEFSPRAYAIGARLRERYCEVQS